MVMATAPSAASVSSCDSDPVWWSSELDTARWNSDLDSDLDTARWKTCCASDLDIRIQQEFEKSERKRNGKIVRVKRISTKDAYPSNI